jgi:FkbM family methyltransferase
LSVRGDSWWRVYGVLSRALAVANRFPVGRRSVRIGPHRLYADSVDRLLALLSWKLGIGEREERALIESVVAPGMVAVDVGANVGLHTLGLADRVGPTGCVHALEPDPRNFALLTQGIAQAGLSNVRLHEVAASDQAGTLTLYVSDANRGDHRTAPAREARRSFSVKAVLLDELLSAEPRIDFMKIDVQGAEVAVFRGFTKTLEKNPGIGVLAELCPELLRRAGTSSGELFSVLRSAGLKPYRILASGDVTPIPENEAILAAERSGYVNLYFKRTP